MSILHTFLQSFSFYIFISNIFSYSKANQFWKLSISYFFFYAQTYIVESAWQLFSYSVSLSEKKRPKVSILYLIWLEIRILVWNKAVLVEWLQKKICKIAARPNWLRSIDISKVTRFSLCQRHISKRGAQRLDYSVYELIPLYSDYSNRKLIQMLYEYNSEYMKNKTLCHVLSWRFK